MPVVDEKYVEDLKKKGRKVPRISTLYGMDRIFKEIYGIPSYIPVSLVCLLEHGVNFQFSFFYERLLKSDFDLIFFDNIHRVNEYRIQSGKESYSIGPLYPKYRKIKNIEPKINRRGTLAFPSHSSSQFDFSKGYKKYATDLKKLPKQYHPITICMYYYDVIQDHYKIFQDEGFNVITNGYIGDPSFPDYLYDNISSFEYTTSNHTGSYAYYSLEMGIPFFLYGDDITENFKELGIMNGVNMNDFLSENFLQMITTQMTFEVEDKVIITPELQKSIEYINDRSNQIKNEKVRNLVINNWIKVLLNKFIGAIFKFFKLK